MENVEDIVESKASVEEICKYIQEHNIDKKSIIENRKFQEKLYKELSETSFSYSCIRIVVEVFGVNNCIENIDLDRKVIKRAKKDMAYKYFLDLNPEKEVPSYSLLSVFRNTKIKDERITNYAKQNRWT